MKMRLVAAMVVLAGMTLPAYAVCDSDKEFRCEDQFVECVKKASGSITHCQVARERCLKRACR